MPKPIKDWPHPRSGEAEPVDIGLDQIAADEVKQLHQIPIDLAQQAAGKDQARQGVRVKVFADGRVAVIMYQFVDHQIVGKFCLLDDGTWHQLSEGEAAVLLSDVVREQVDEIASLPDPRLKYPDGLDWKRRS